MKIKKIFLLLMSFFCCQSFFCKAFESNLELANKYYDADDYENASKYFRKVILSDVADPVVFYRFGYSFENINANKKFVIGSYKISAYLFEENNNVENRYYQAALNKEQQLGFNHADVNLSYIENFKKDLRWSIGNGSATTIVEYWKGLDKKIKIIVIVIAVLIYAVAWFLSGGECVIVYTWWDMFLLIVAGGLLYVYCNSSFDEIKNSPVCLEIFLSAIIISLIISFIANINSSFPCNILYFILSLFTKIILILIAPLILFSIFSSFGSGDKDRRYKDGTRNNKKTSNVVTIFLLIGLLVKPLVKTSRKSKISKIIDDFGDADYTSNYFRNQNRR